MTRTRLLTSSLLAALCLLGSFTLGLVTADEAVSGPDAGAGANEPFPVNDAGQTYGSDFGSKSRPDLVLARGDHGKHGYVKAAEVYYDPVVTLEDAQREAAKPPEPRTINLYAQDGTTVIDTFTLPVSVGAGSGR
jgi:hypothetical protein